MEKLFQALHPILGSKHAKFAGNFLKGAISFMGKVDLDGDGTPDGSLNSKLDFTDYLPGKDSKPKKEIVLILDDLERSSMPMSELLGYINYLVEISKNKIILLANESHILKEDNNNVYNTFKEKVVGKTFSVNHDIDNILEPLLNGNEHSYLHEHIEVIKDIYNSSQTKNIRKLKQSISDFDYLSSSIHKKYFENTTFTSALIKTFFAINIEAKRGHLTEKKLRYNRTLVNIKHNEDLIFEKYSFNDTYLYPANVWADIIFKGKLDEVNDETSKLAFFLEKTIKEPEPPQWQDLYYFYTLENNEFNHLIEKVKKDILNFEKEEVINFIQKLDLINYFKKNKIIEFNIFELKNLVAKYISTNKSNEMWINSYPKNFSNTYFLSKEYNDSNFNEIINILYAHYNEVYKNNIQNEIDKQSELLKSKVEFDLESTIDILLQINRTVAIFEHVDSKVFVENLFSTNTLFKQFQKVLRERYLSHDSYNNRPYSFYLSSELPFWKEVQIKLDIKLEKITNKTLSTHILILFSKGQLTEIISCLSSDKT